MCLSRGGCRARPFDMDSRKPAFMSCALRPVFLEPKEAIPSGSSPLRKGIGLSLDAWGALFLGECRYFWNHPASEGYGHAPGSLNKRSPVPYSWGAWQISGFSSEMYAVVYVALQPQRHLVKHPYVELDHILPAQFRDTLPKTLM